MKYFSLVMIGLVFGYMVGFVRGALDERDFWQHMKPYWQADK